MSKSLPATVPRLGPLVRGRQGRGTVPVPIPPQHRVQGSPGGAGLKGAGKTMPPTGRCQGAGSDKDVDGSCCGGFGRSKFEISPGAPFGRTIQHGDWGGREVYLQSRLLKRTLLEEDIPEGQRRLAVNEGLKLWNGKAAEARSLLIPPSPFCINTKSKHQWQKVSEKATRNCPGDLAPGIL